MKLLGMFAGASLCFLVSSCSSETDRVVSGPSAGAVVSGNRQSELQPGPITSTRTFDDPLEENEAYLAEGKRLYNNFNCSGCHASGGGAIGPAFLDDEWVYGKESSNIFWTIVEGRPQGMPAFGGRIPERQLWQIVAYVRSLSGLNKDEDTPPGPQQSAMKTK
jgi:cytochrome c oxidase cbb3-type subunit 3